MPDGMDGGGDGGCGLDWLKLTVFSDWFGDGVRFGWMERCRREEEEMGEGE